MCLFVGDLTFRAEKKECIQEYEDEVALLVKLCVKI